MKNAAIPVIYDSGYAGSAMTIREQAEYNRLLLSMGFESREDVIEWADQLLLNTDVPVQIMDVSLAAQKKDHELDALLAKVPGEGDMEFAAHAALWRFKIALRDLPLEDAVKKLVAYGNTAKISEAEHEFATLFRVLYEDMLSGHCGSEDELWQRLGAFVHQHATQYIP